MNVLLKLCVLEPQLLMAHAKSYSDLMMEALQQALATWKLRVLMFALAFACLCFSALIGLISVLLWAALPVLNEQSAWVLVMLPVALMLLSWFFYALAQSFKLEPVFNDIQEQLHLDLLAICQAQAK
jgi:hypothetical protein